VHIDAGPEMVVAYHVHHYGDLPAQTVPLHSVIPKMIKWLYYHAPYVPHNVRKELEAFAIRNKNPCWVAMPVAGKEDLTILIE